MPEQIKTASIRENNENLLAQLAEFPGVRPSVEREVSTQALGMITAAARSGSPIQDTEATRDLVMAAVLGSISTDGNIDPIKVAVYKAREEQAKRHPSSAPFRS